MKLTKLNQKALDKIMEEYYQIAFPAIKDLLIMYQNYDQFMDYLNQGMGGEGYRFGILGWPHTKLRFTMNGDNLRFYIYPNGDKFSKKQVKILDNLNEWAKGI